MSIPDPKYLTHLYLWSRLRCTKGVFIEALLDLTTFSTKLCFCGQTPSKRGYLYFSKWHSLISSLVKKWIEKALKCFKQVVQNSDNFRHMHFKNIAIASWLSWFSCEVAIPSGSSILPLPQFQKACCDHSSVWLWSFISVLISYLVETLRGQ